MTLNDTLMRRLWMLCASVHGLCCWLIAAILIYQPQFTFMKEIAFYELPVGLSAILFVLWLRPKRLERLRQRIPSWRGSVLIILLVICAGMGLTLWFNLMGFVGYLVLATFILLLWTLFADETVAFSRPIVYLVAGAAILIVLLRLYTLAIYPTIDRIDEGWSLGITLSWLKTGQRGDLLMNIDGSGRALVNNHLSPMFSLLPALWMRVVGIGYWEARVFSYLLTFAIIALTARAADFVYGKVGAVFTAITLFISSIVMASVTTRPDMGLMLAVALSLCLHTEAQRRNSNLLHLLAGFAIGAGAFAHLHAALLGVALAIGLYAPAYIIRLQYRHLLPETQAVLFAVGGLIAALIYAVVMILPDVQNFMAIISPRGSATRYGFLYSFFNSFGNIYAHSRVEFAAVTLGLIAAVVRRAWWLVVLFFAAHVALGIMTGIAGIQYIRPLAPIYALLIGGLFSSGFQKASSLTWRKTAAFALFGITALFITLRTPLDYVVSGGTLHLQPTPAVQWIQENVSPDETILGPNVYYLWLHEYHYLSTYIVFQYENEMALENVQEEAVWENLDADVLIFDSSQPSSMRPASLFDVDYVRDHGYVVAAAFVSEDGRVVIYRRDN